MTSTPNTIKHIETLDSVLGGSKLGTASKVPAYHKGVTADAGHIGMLGTSAY